VYPTSGRRNATVERQRVRDAAIKFGSGLIAAAILAGALGLLQPAGQPSISPLLAIASWVDLTLVVVTFLGLALTIVYYHAVRNRSR